MPITRTLLSRALLGRVTGAVGISGLLKQYEAAGEEALTPPANSNGIGALVYQEIALRRAATPDASVPRLQFGGRVDWYTIDTRAGEAKFGPATSASFASVCLKSQSYMPMN